MAYGIIKQWNQLLKLPCKYRATFFKKRNEQAVRGSPKPYVQGFS